MVPAPVTPEEAAFVLHLWDRADLYEDLMWRVDRTDGSYDVRMHANCSDLFFWATADCEEILPADFPLLVQTLQDLEAVGCAYNLPELFAARKRKLRPQAPCYKHFEDAVKPLFDACCTTEERADADRKDQDWWIAFVHSQKAKK